MQFLETLTVWHWVILGIVLLILEALGASGLTLGLSLAAFAVALGMGIGLLTTWQMQLLIFAILSVVFTALVWQFFRREKAAPEAAELNDLAARLVGRRVELLKDLPTGQGKIQIGDTLWAIEAEQPLKKGDLIEVIGYQSSLLKVKAIS